MQRSLAAKTLTHAKGGSLLAAYLKVLPFFAIMIPGMISRILYTGTVRTVCCSWNTVFDVQLLLHIITLASIMVLKVCEVFR